MERDTLEAIDGEVLDHEFKQPNAYVFTIEADDGTRYRERYVLDEIEELDSTGAGRDRPDIEVGDEVVYRTGNERRTISVTGRFDDVKDGRPGFEGHLISSTGSLEEGTTVWGYDSQLVQIL